MRISVVVDYNISIQPLVNYINKRYITISSSEQRLPLAKIMYKYSVIPITSNQNSFLSEFETESNLDRLKEKVNEISLREFILDHKINTHQRDIIKDYLSSEFGCKFDMILTSGELYLPQIPYVYTGYQEYSSLWLTQEYIDGLRKRLNDLPDNMVSLGVDDMTMYIIRQSYPELLLSVQILIHPINNRLIYIVPQNSLDPSLINSIRKDMGEASKDLRAGGIFSIHINPTDKVNVDVLNKDWNQELIEYNDGTMIIKQNDLSLFPELPGNMILRSFISIDQGSLPVVMMGGNWQGLKQNSQNQVRLIWMMLNIGKDFDDYLPYVLDQISVEKSLNVRIPMVNFKSYNLFKQKINENLDTIESIFVQEVDTIEDSFILRSMLYDKYQAVYLTLKIDGKIYVVGKMGEPMIIDSISRITVKNRLIIYYRNLGPEIFSQENIENMSIKDMIFLIKPEEDSNYCVSVQGLKDFGKGTSIITRKSLSSDTLKLMDTPHLCVSGYLPCAYLPGLFNKYPCKPKINGNLESMFMPMTNGFSVHLNNKMYEVITFDKPVGSDMMNKLKQLWNNGVFISLYDIYVFNSNNGAFPDDYVITYDIYNRDDKTEYYSRV